MSKATAGELIPISRETRLNLCRLGQGPATCRYLVYMGVWCCGKGSFPSLGQAPLTAQGDNCSGPPDFVPLEPRS